MNKPTERPIIFSNAMILALLKGHKTQTRRIIKGLDGDTPLLVSNEPEVDGPNEWHVLFEHEARRVIKCPYGQPGDRLWVREEWQAWKEFDAVKANGLTPEMRARINYPADGNTWDSKMRLGMFMPRWASRITLEIVRVHAERVQEITEEDARAEGAVWHTGNPFIEPGEEDHAVRCFSELWDGIYHDKPEKQWAANLWVWVLDFKVHLNQQPSLLQVLEAL